MRKNKKEYIYKNCQKTEQMYSRRSSILLNANKINCLPRAPLNKHQPKQKKNLMNIFYNWPLMHQLTQLISFALKKNTWSLWTHLLCFPTIYIYCFAYIFIIICPVSPWNLFFRLIKIMLYHLSMRKNYNPKKAGPISVVWMETA